MKKCPTCGKTFDDGLRFCQTDGTPLLDASETASDPYKTVVSSQNEIPAPPADPFKTMIGVPPIKKDEDDILQLPKDDAREKDVAPPSPFGDASSSKKAGGAFDDFASSPLEIPKINEPFSNAPSFGGFSSPESKSEGTNSSDSTLVLNSSETSGSEIDSSYSKGSSGRTDFDNAPNQAIPSPFDNSMPPGYQTPSSPPFKEPEQPFGNQNNPFNQTPFEQSQPPFGQQSASYNPPVQQTEWTPPPAPVSNWQDQELGANTPFQPPVAGKGQNQTLAIVSLVCGILSFVLICCYGGIPFGLAALITGFLGMQNVNKNPAAYSGKTLAMIGMILGGIAFVLNIILIIFGIAGGILSNIQR